MIKNILLTLSLTFLGLNAHAAPTDVVIPDTNFKAALIVVGVDKNNDGIIQATEAAAIRSLDINTQLIADLTGIEAFTALDSLTCYDNILTSLNLSANTQLTFLDCAGNKLKVLNLSTNTKLQEADCSNNSIISLDLNSNPNLVSLICNDNKLTTLNLNTNHKLSLLRLSHNFVTDLNITADTALTYIECNDNLISALDVSNCIHLDYLNCEYNELSSLDVSKNKILTMLNADNNPELPLICINTIQLGLTKTDIPNWTKPAITCNWNTTNCAANPVGIYEYSVVIPKTLIHIIDLYGREIHQNEIINGIIYIYQYSDGTVQKIVRL
jgi:hypothetical protein